VHPPSCVRKNPLSVERRSFLGCTEAIVAVYA